MRSLFSISSKMSHASDNDLYIGVTKRRKCSVGSEKKKLVSTLAFHEVSRGDEEYLYVVGDGIKTGDTFQFFYPYPEGALMSRNVVFDNLRALKQSNADKKVMCGGLIFSCCGRGESFLEQPNADSLAFSENFEGVSLSGVFCCGEIGRSSVSIGQDNGAMPHLKNNETLAASERKA
ncbi:hypothetical protein IFM89_000553 [Coptis chinensis]|uniref:FIST C-domain domain-containing protein n=1 Tax=Coptis chinensis TaxID=261450 RepID=A0A835IHR6_9MAGN|nr:hypothetical protein IFM89_000553 [Coptis chinensis]